MAKVEDMGKYFRIPLDNRELNYAQYFSEGEQIISNMEDYTSHNTERLDIGGVKEKLMQLDIIKEALND